MWRAWAVAAVGLALVGAAALVYFEPFPPIGYGDRREDEVFKDCDACPEMIPIPAGAFTMGDQRRTQYWLSKVGLYNQPVREAVFTRPFAVGRYEVTFAQWDACVADGGCNGFSPSDEGWGRGARPVINVTWDDAQAYVQWLRARTGRPYRLLSEAEWEYAARAGTPTLFSWGRRPDRNLANFGECKPCRGVVAGKDAWLNTAPVGQFPPNRWGVFDVHGNVYEWVEDCYQPALPAVTFDGAAVTSGVCDHRVMRGGTWYSAPRHIMSFYRSYNRPEGASNAIGFRVARDL